MLCRLQSSTPHRATFANYTPVIDMSYALNAPESVCFHFYWIKHVGCYRSFLYVFRLDCFWIEFRFVRFDTREGWLASSSPLQHHFLFNAIDFFTEVLILFLNFEACPYTIYIQYIYHEYGLLTRISPKIAKGKLTNLKYTDYSFS